MKPEEPLQPMVPIWSQINPVYTSKPILLRSVFILFSHVITRFAECSLPFRRPNQSFVSIYHLPYACYVPHPSYPPQSYQRNNYDVKRTNKLWSTPIPNFLHRPKVLLFKSKGRLQIFFLIHHQRVCHFYSVNWQFSSPCVKADKTAFFSFNKILKNQIGNGGLHAFCARCRNLHISSEESDFSLLRRRVLRYVFWGCCAM
jgi:hypothetical protein